MFTLLVPLLTTACWALPAAIPENGPTIAHLEPTPLPQGSLAQITGTNFTVDLTSVKIGDVPQQVILVQPTAVRFTVSLDTPLGEQTLIVTTPTGEVSAVVTVMPPVPTIDTVAPDEPLIGGLMTLQGENLETVFDVTLDGLSVAIQEAKPYLVMVEIPFSIDLIGTVDVALVSPSGIAHRNVKIAAPAPDIESVAPNPLRAGDLMTVRGHILPTTPSVSIGASEAPIIRAATGAYLTWVPATLGPGSYDVIVRAAGVASVPTGPVFVQAPEADAPTSLGTYPAKVAHGGDFWLVGEHLDSLVAAFSPIVTEAGEEAGPTLVGCERRGCRMSTAGLAPHAPFKGALSGPKGAVLYEIEVTDAEPVVPHVTSYEPAPAFRGQKVTLHGTHLESVRSVFIGAKAQSITFFDVDRVEFTLESDTPMGLEPGFVAGSTGSEAFGVTVLDPFPIESGPDSADAEAPVEVVDDAPETASAEAPDATVAKGASGCAGAPDEGTLAVGLACLVAVRRAVRRSSRG